MTTVRFIMKCQHLHVSFSPSIKLFAARLFSCGPVTHYDIVLCLGRGVAHETLWLVLGVTQSVFNIWPKMYTLAYVLVLAKRRLIKYYHWSIKLY